MSDTGHDKRCKCSACEFNYRDHADAWTGGRLWSTVEADIPRLAKCFHSKNPGDYSWSWGFTLYLHIAGFMGARALGILLDEMERNA